MVSGSVRFGAAKPAVYVYLARDALAHAAVKIDDDDVDRVRTFRAQYEYRLFGLEVTATAEVQIDPPGSIARRHVDGLLTGTVEVFRLGVAPGGSTLVSYEAQLQLRGPFGLPVVRHAAGALLKRDSIAALKRVRTTLDGKRIREGDGWLVDGGGGDYDGSGGGGIDLS
jgi:hypothetical protein